MSNGKTGRPDNEIIADAAVNAIEGNPAPLDALVKDELAGGRVDLKASEWDTKVRISHSHGEFEIRRNKKSGKWKAVNVRGKLYAEIHGPLRDSIEEAKRDTYRVSLFLRP